MTSGSARGKKPRPAAPVVEDGAGAAVPDSERVGISFLAGRDNLDEHFMREALLQARRALEADEVPVGAVVVLGNRVIARAHNQVETLKDATAHAEMIALTQAASAVGDWRLGECTLYVTKEPCFMCSGAAVNARLKRIVFGAEDKKCGGCGSTTINIPAHKDNYHNPEVVSGVRGQECLVLLQAFFKKARLREKNPGQPA